MILLTIPLTILYPVVALFFLLNASEAIPLLLSGPPAIILIMQGAGTFLLTAPVPPAHASPEQTATRVLARLAIPAWIAGFCVVAAILLTSGFEFALYTVLFSTFGPLATVAVAAVWPLAIMQHTRVLMSQVPRPRLERLLGVACMTILVSAILYALGPRVFPVPVVAIIGGITLIGVAMAYVLLLLAWIALSKAAHQAADLAVVPSSDDASTQGPTSHK